MFKKSGDKNILSFDTTYRTINKSVSVSNFCDFWVTSSSQNLKYLIKKNFILIFETLTGIPIDYELNIFKIILVRYVIYVHL